MIFVRGAIVMGLSGERARRCSGFIVLGDDVSGVTRGLAPQCDVM